MATLTQPSLALLQNFHANAAKGTALYNAFAQIIVDLAAIEAQDSTGTYTCLSGDAVGDVVYISAANTVAKADADDAAKRPAIGIIVSKPTTTSAVVQFFGEVTGLSGLTAGAAYYLDTTAGGKTATPPSGNVQLLGFAKSTTILHLIPSAIAFLLSSTSATLGASLIGVQDVATIITATNVEAALAELAVLAHAAPAMQAVNATLASGTITINTGITVAANSEVVPLLIGALSGTTNFGMLGELKASRVNGAPSTGTVVIQAYGDDGAIDVDAAGAIRVLILTPQ